jgi:hypothetical protein
VRFKLLSLFIIFSLFGCKEETIGNLETKIIKVTLNGTALYEYKFSDSFPVEKRLRHWETSTPLPN